MAGKPEKYELIFFLTYIYIYKFGPFKENLFFFLIDCNSVEKFDSRFHIVVLNQSKIMSSCSQQSLWK
jgi:hypothetical protein